MAGFASWDAMALNAIPRWRLQVAGGVARCGVPGSLADAYMRVAVIASAIVAALRAPVADPLIGIGIALILRVTRQSWAPVREHHSR